MWMFVKSMKSDVSKRNFATYRQVKRRSVGIKDIITKLKTLNSPVKKQVANIYVQEISNLTSVPLTQYNTVVVDRVFEYLKSLKDANKYIVLHETLYKYFAEHVADIGFMKFVATKLGIEHSKRFFDSAQSWKANSFIYHTPT